MSDDVKKVLGRLNRRLGREAARMERISKAAAERGNGSGADRFLGEANVLRLAQSFVRQEIRKADGKAGR